MSMLILSKRLKELRKEKGLSQTIVSNTLSISQQLYSNWENATREPNISMLIKIADYYEISVDYLIGRKDY